MTVLTGATQEGEAGATLSTPISVKVVDRESRAVTGAVVSFSIPLGGGRLSASIDTTDAEGVASVVWTLGESAGASRAEARVPGVMGAAVFNATIKAGAPIGIQRISTTPGTSAGGFELPDSVAVKLADQYGNAVASTNVTFAIAAGGGTVSPTTTTTDADGVAKALWKLGNSGPQSLSISAGGLQSTVNATATACTETQIGVGAVLTIGPSDPKCVVLTNSAQRYFITVVNTTPSVSAAGSFRVRGAGAGTGTTASEVSSARAATSFGLSSAARAEVEEAHDRIQRHDALLRANERVMQRLTPRLAEQRAFNRMSNMAPPVAPPQVGDTVDLRIPGNFSDLCSLQGASAIRARVVFSGSRGVMLEDINAPLAGQADSLYRMIGQEFDTNMWSILNNNFGNPLAMDPQTDNNERFYMLFSKVINDMQGGQIAGFVSSSDFYPNSLCPSSNVGEVFYARVPTAEGSGFTRGTMGDWYRRTRTVMIHEVKHIASFAERISRGIQTTTMFNNGDRWLEEATAMMAEEIWARSIFGYQSKANVDYAQSIYCEVRVNETSFPQCPQPYKPVAMFDHFILFYDYQNAVENHTPIGAVNTSDFTFYGSGWAFLRWVIDNYATSESAFLSALTKEISLAGVQNVEARASKTFTEMINDWSIAVATDDYPGFVPVNPKHKLASWNTRDIFNGMSTDFSSQGFFTRRVPLQIRAAAFGKFAIDVSSVRGGTMAVFEVTGTQTGRQMFEFNGAAGSSFPADMRVNIIRIQ